MTRQGKPNQARPRQVKLRHGNKAKPQNSNPQADKKSFEAAKLHIWFQKIFRNRQARSHWTHSQLTSRAGQGRQEETRTKSPPPRPARGLQEALRGRGGKTRGDKRRADKRCKTRGKRRQGKTREKVPRKGEATLHVATKQSKGLPKPLSPRRLDPVPTYFSCI